MRPDGGRGHRGGRRRPEPDDRRPEPDAPESPEPIDPDAFMPAAVFMVPDKDWGIEAIDRDDHPGVCSTYPREDDECDLLKGSGSWVKVRWKPTYIVDPSPRNGLTKRTAFDLVPIRMRKRRLCLMYPGRWLGHLDDDDFSAIRRELERIFPIPHR